MRANRGERRSRALALTLPLAVSFAVAAPFAGGGCGAGDTSEAARPPPSNEGGVDAADGATVASPLCVDGKPAGEWPAGPYELALTSVLPPDLVFEGPNGPVKLKDYYEPCAPRSRLLVIRSAAAWCGPCGWHAKNTSRLFGEARYADRLRLVDLLVADEDNMPATPAAAARWATRISGAADAKVAVDASYTFAVVLPAKNVLPEYVLVDTRTMRLRTVMSDPDPQTFGGYVDIELALLDGKPRVDLPERNLHDDLLTDDQWELLQDMKLPGAPPADPTNEFGDIADAATLGKKLFEDKTLSPSGTVACQTCHDATKAFADGLKQSTGVTVGDRNSPSIALAAHSRWQFWDGRADTLWMQALGPFENDKEFASSRLFVAHAISDRYAAEYAAVFGAKYPLPDISALPAAGRPGDPAWQALSQTDRDAVTRIYVNVGKAIAAFERTLRVQPNALDRYAAGDMTALAGVQKQALQQFFKVGCTQCHWGPRLTDDAFHVIRFPTGRQDGAADKGRAEVLLGLASAEFVASSKWSDAPASAKPLVFTTAPPSMDGAFKTPTLRGVTQSAPYGHGGSLALLSDVANHYGQRGSAVIPAKAAGTAEEWLPAFDVNVRASLPALLDVLTADVE